MSETTKAYQERARVIADRMGRLGCDIDREQMYGRTFAATWEHAGDCAEAARLLRMFAALASPETTE